MKTYIDLVETYKSLFLSNRRMKNRLIRYWGTTTIDGVEVFNKKKQVWPNTSDKDVVKILKLFGAYASITTAKFEGITSYYLWLNPAKSSSLLDEAIDDVLVNRINGLVSSSPFKVNINYYNSSKAAEFVTYSPSQVSNYILTNYNSLFTAGILECRGDTVAQEVVGLYAPLDSGSNFKVDVVSAGVTPISEVYQVASYKAGLTVQLEITKISPVVKEDVVTQAMLNETNVLRRNKLRALIESDTDVPTEHFNWITRNTGQTDEIWYKGQLRVATTNSAYLDRDKFLEIVTGSLDTVYVKKKAKSSWWKKLVSIVVVVIAVVLSVPTGGLSMATIGTFAVNLGIASLVLTAVQFVLAKTGDTGWAMYLGKLVQVVSVVSAITGIGAFVQNAMTKVATSSIVESAIGAVKEAFSDVATAASNFAKDMSISNGLNVLGTKIVSIGAQLVEKLMEMRVDTAAKDLRSVQAQVAQSAEELADLTDKEMHIGVEDIKYYTKPLTLDNIQFEVDYLYEGTLMNIGRPSFHPTGLNLIDE